MTHRYRPAKIGRPDLGIAIQPISQIRIPKLERTITSRDFTFSDIESSTFRQLGQRLSAEGGTDLDRKVLNVVEDPNHPSGLRLVPTTSTDKVAASAPNLPLSEARQQFIDTVLSFDEVAETKANVNAAGRLADALIEGAGNETALAAQFQAVLDAIRVTIRRLYREAPAHVTDMWTTDAFGPTRPSSRPVDPNRYGPFSRKTAYSGWKKSLHSVNWFDSNPERRFANLVDDDDKVKLWACIQRGELVIPWNGGSYHPDFYVRSGDDHYLVEVKADKHLEDAEVQAMRDAARNWARKVTDDGWPRHLALPACRAERGGEQLNLRRAGQAGRVMPGHGRVKDPG